MKKIYLALFVFAVAPFPGQSQKIVIGSDTVEFVGLNKNTVTRLSQEVKDFSACAQVMKDKFGFKETAVYKYFEDNHFRQIVLAVEPQDNKWVKYTDAAEFTNKQAAPFLPAEKMKYFTNPVMLSSFILDVGRYLQKKETSGGIFLPDSTSYSKSDYNKAQIMFGILEDLSKRTSADMLLSTISTDTTRMNRVMATLLLSFYHNNDQSFFALMKALKDPFDDVNSIAWTQLFVMNKYLSRPVKWEDVHDVQDILNGTDLRAFSITLRLLVSTEIDPVKGKQLLNRMSCKLLEGLLVSESNSMKTTAQKFLIRVSGENYGDNSNDWITWMQQQQNNKKKDG